MRRRVWVMVGLLLLAGCGRDDGPRKFHVKGKVTFDGAPLDSGLITFIPDADRGNSGPPGYAVIRKGEFDTHDPGGKPTVSGPLKALLTGFDPEASSAGEQRPPLFDGYPAEIEIDSKKAVTSVDFNVPAEAHRKKAASQKKPTSTKSP